MSKYLILCLCLVFLSCVEQKPEAVTSSQSSDMVVEAKALKVKAKVETEEIKIGQIHDGDTFISADGEKIRLADVDCPEMDQPYGKSAKTDFLSLVLNKNITIDRLGKDRYGRTIGRIKLNGKNVADNLIEAGDCWWYQKFSDQDYLGDLEAYAKKNKLGLWKEDYPTPPWEWRKKGK